jgi:hypothetical protein
MTGDLNQPISEQCTKASADLADLLLSASMAMSQAWYNYKGGGFMDMRVSINGGYPQIIQVKP